MNIAEEFDKEKVTDLFLVVCPGFFLYSNILVYFF